MGESENSTNTVAAQNGIEQLPDIHRGCGDSIALNIFVKKTKYGDLSDGNRANNYKITNLQKIRLMKKYQPFLLLYKDEKYLPSTVDFFIANTQEEKVKDNIWLYVDDPLKFHKFYKGQQPDQAGVYAFWVDKWYGPEVTYFYFYPYNGDTLGLGAHVGDWEHATVRFSSDNAAKNVLNPVEMYVGYHASGFTQPWDSGIQFHDKTHPKLKVSTASHGMHFFDSTDEVISFVTSRKKFFNPKMLQTYDNSLKSELKLANIKNDRVTIKPWPTWLTRIFRWGNTEKKPCFFGACRLEDGPTGPLYKHWVFNFDEYEH